MMRALDWLRLRCEFCGITSEEMQKAGLRSGHGNDR